MEHRYYERGNKFMESYRFFKSLVPNSSRYIHLRALEKPKVIPGLPGYIFDASHNKENSFQKEIILTLGKFPKKFSNTSFSPSSDGLSSKKEKKIAEQEGVVKVEHSTMTNPNIQESNSVFNLKGLKSPNIIGSGKDFRSSAVRVYQYKKNLYLPSITQRLKQSKPRYAREESKFNCVKK